MKKQIFVLLLCLCAVFLVCIIGVKKRKQDCINYEIKVSKDGLYFGTIFNITLYGNDEERMNRAVSKAYAECARLEKIFSVKLSDSELTLVNESAFEKEVVISSELFEVIETAMEFGEKSDGTLNIAIGKIIDLWGIGTENERVPSEKEIEELLGISIKDVVLNKEKSSIKYKDSRIKLDLGAVAKGYAADRIKELILSEYKECVGMINFGGNIVQIGAKNGKDNWNVGITDPADNKRVYATLSLKNLSIVTSGNYERYFIQNQKKYHHIIDPLTGFPADSKIAGATVIGPDSMRCDALSTILFILGKDKGLSLINSLQGYEAVLIDDNGKYYGSDGINKFGFTPKV